MSVLLLDWQFWAQLVGAVFGLLGQLLVNRRLIRGYYFWTTSNFVLIVLQASLGMWVLAILHCIYLVLCIEGMIKWRKIPIDAAAD